MQSFFRVSFPRRNTIFSDKSCTIYREYLHFSHGTYSLRVKNGSSPRSTHAKLLRRTVSYSKLFSSPLVVSFVCKIMSVSSRFDYINLFTKLGYVHYASCLCVTGSSFFDCIET